jgi:hypothetical protein
MVIIVYGTDTHSGCIKCYNRVVKQMQLFLKNKNEKLATVSKVAKFVSGLATAKTVANNGF